MATELRTPSLAYDDLGAGEPALLLLTGWCSSRARWAHAAPLLARHRRVVSFDYRGHGDSGPADGDFGTAEMVQDALAVIEATGLRTFIPCAASHSGWVAIELARRLGSGRVPAIVHLDWLLIEPSEAYSALLVQLQSPDGWERARDTLFEIWRAGDSSAEISEALSVMKRHDAEMWMRSGREISGEYARDRSPLRALSALEPPRTVMHLYGQPPAPEYLEVQQRFAAEHDWFSVRRLDGRTHFSMIETPEAVAGAIEEVARAVAPA
jgi:pimeloyl-ACP methyl ester carboxylesterase